MAALCVGLAMISGCGGSGGGSSGGSGGSTSSSSSSSSSASSSSSSSSSSASDLLPAEQLTRVENFGDNQGELNMYAYVPTGLAANRPLVMILPGCGDDAVNYDDETGWTKWADAMGFSLVIAETTTQYQGCFSFYNPADQERGAGEPATLIAMIDWMKSRYAVDSSRVFVTGFSGGGAMTNVMLATYPDVFAAGAPIAGMPYKCASTVTEADTCAAGVTVSAQTLGDRVRAAYPAYTGNWPRVSIWQGTADGTVNFSNEAQTMLQWTNVHGEDQTPEISNTVAGYPHNVYGANLVETYAITNMGHSIPVAPGSGTEQCGGGGSTTAVGICGSLYIARWFGLDQ